MLQCSVQWQDRDGLPKHFLKPNLCEKGYVHCLANDKWNHPKLETITAEKYCENQQHVTTARFTSNIENKKGPVLHDNVWL